METAAVAEDCAWHGAADWAAAQGMPAGAAGRAPSLPCQGVAVRHAAWVVAWWQQYEQVVSSHGGTLSAVAAAEEGGMSVCSSQSGLALWQQEQAGNATQQLTVGGCSAEVVQRHRGMIRTCSAALPSPSSLSLPPASFHLPHLTSSPPPPPLHIPRACALHPLSPAVPAGASPGAAVQRHHAQGD